MNFRDIQAARKEREKGFEEFQDTFRAVLVAVDFLNSALVAGRPGYVWFQELEQHDDATPGQAFNRKAPDLPGLKVTVKRWPKVPYDYEVLEWDASGIKNLPGYTGTPLLPRHAQDHIDGYDPLLLPTRNLAALRSYITPGSSGFLVNVAPYGRNFAGQNDIDLSASQPASGLARYVLVYLRTSDWTIQTVDGATATDLDTVPPVKPDVPDGGIASAYVRLDGDQAAIAKEDIVEGREFLNVEQALDNLSASTDPTVNDDAGDGYGVGSLWINTTADTAWISLDASAGAAVWQELGAGGGSSITVQNTSGATAAAGDVGYIDEAGEYKTTTTIALNANWCIVVTGGANNADITVANTGSHTVNYAGTDPVAGGFLITSSTGGKAQYQESMRPEVIAVCLANSSGGTVEVLLYTRRVFVPATSANFVFNQVSIDDKTTSWTGTVNDGAPTTSPVTVATSTSNINTITPASANDEFKIVLRNTTRSNEALIDSISGNDITFVDDTPLSTWQNGDSLTAQTDAHAQPFQTLDLSQSSVPALATAILVNNLISDTGSASIGHGFHPYESYSASKVLNVQTQVANVFFRGMLTVPIIARKITQQSSASGSGTFSAYVLLVGYWVASP